MKETNPLKETAPLQWPSGWQRTLPEKQETNSQWKKPYKFYVAMLETELKRIGAVRYLLTSNPSGDRDPGVAIWFSRKRKDDFSWRETLRISDAYPTLSQIDDAYRALVKIYHPEGSGGDVEIFRKITMARTAAKAWLGHSDEGVLDSAIGADKFKEARLNVAALANSIRHIRGLDRCGTSAIMEKTLQGFAQLAEKAESHVVASA